MVSILGSLGKAEFSILGIFWSWILVFWVFFLVFFFDLKCLIISRYFVNKSNLTRISTKTISTRKAKVDFI